MIAAADAFCVLFVPHTEHAAMSVIDLVAPVAVRFAWRRATAPFKYAQHLLIREIR
jgi:hypothetical protein